MSCITRVDEKGFKYCDLSLPQGVERDVLLVSGEVHKRCGQLVSVFDSPWHARKERSLGSISTSFLTSEQIAISKQNLTILQLGK